MAARAAEDGTLDQSAEAAAWAAEWSTLYTDYLKRSASPTFVSHSCNGSERAMTQVSLPGPEDRRADTEVTRSALGEL